MILLTVGTQLPFDRLVQYMDDIAPRIGKEIFGQIGASNYKPKNFEAIGNIDAKEFDAAFRRAELVVAHAGIGTILTAQRLRKPLILVPRIAAMGEHRNDHQVATCNQVRSKVGIYVAKDSAELERLLTGPELTAADPDADLAGRGKFVANLRSFLLERQ